MWRTSLTLLLVWYPTTPSSFVLSDQTSSSLLGSSIQRPEVVQHWKGFQEEKPDDLSFILWTNNILLGQLLIIPKYLKTTQAAKEESPCFHGGLTYDGTLIFKQIQHTKWQAHVYHYMYRWPVPLLPVSLDFAWVLGYFEALNGWCISTGHQPPEVLLIQRAAWPVLSPKFSASIASLVVISHPSCKAISAVLACCQMNALKLFTCYPFPLLPFAFLLTSVLK